MSRPRLLGSGIMLAMLLLGASWGAPQPATAAPPVAPTGIAVDVTVEPMDAARTQFMCRARITELPSGALLASPNLHTLQGRSSTARSSGESADQVVFVATVEEGGAAASYSVEYRKGAVLIATQKGAISLSPAPRTTSD